MDSPKKSKEAYEIYEEIIIKDNYKLSLGLSNNKYLIIELTENEKSINKKYTIQLSLQDLMQKSKIFKTCDSINECINLIKKLYQEKLLSIIPMENSVKIHFSEFMLSKEFDIILEVKKIEPKEIIEQLSNKVKQLEEKIENLENWKKEVEKKINGYIEKKQVEEIDSKIITKKEEIEFLEKCLKKDDPIFSKKNIQFKLLYRATKDGDGCSVFHSRVDKKYNVLFIIQTIKGLKFGGYTEQTWEGDNPKEDNNLFAFSLDYFKKYNPIKGKKCMSPDKTRGPRFEPWIIWTGENFLSQNGNTCEKSSASNYFEGFSKDYEINNGELYFTINEFEAFQIIMS